MRSFRFLNWLVYEDSKKLFHSVFVLVNKLPAKHRFELGGQIVRSAQSIVLNIAEGGGKSSDKELNRYVEVALGSAYETLAGLDLLRDVGLIPQKEFDTYLCRHRIYL